ncbi:unnamed protein product [Vitrella brassicaformis CCMP3155]|uniref:Tic20 family protein Ycf60 n=1 Tax=Vitrella brassicaformis (strain CCMP3155) TaxID=1169540 RepID=A0A0G4E846_VITBC|nr:unnamed protein product [Vitrella brassicaformis CCMP3155]|eukprot:CEL91598.1 unnamed protein product [Vitrella brassicaformis CCMP3155]
MRERRQAAAFSTRLCWAWIVTVFLNTQCHLAATVRGGPQAFVAPLARSAAGVPRQHIVSRAREAPLPLSPVVVPVAKDVHPCRARGELSMSKYSVGARDRLVACVPYILPTLDLRSFASFVFLKFPVAGQIFFTLTGPFMPLYSAPFVSFIIFIALSILSRNQPIGSFQPNFSRFVRFSMQQALLLNIYEIAGNFVLGLVTYLPVKIALTNFLFFFIGGCIIYSFISNVIGELPDQIPLVSAQAEQSIGPN